MKMGSNGTDSEVPPSITPPSNHANDTYLELIIGVVIAVLVLVLLLVLLVVLRYMYRHKGTYHTHEAKGSELAESADSALRADPVLQDAVQQSNKEYFI